MDDNDNVVETMLNELRRIKPLMEKKRGFFIRFMGYDACADAFFWTDELPKKLNWDARNSLRPVLHYRTCLLVGNEQDKEQWQEFWDVARESFPNWVGFSDSRCKPNERLRRLYLATHEKQKSPAP